LIFTIQATAALAPAANHSWITNPAASPVRPIRAFSLRRSISISTQPAMPAEAVSPAAPQIGGTPSERGKGMANR